MSVKLMGDAFYLEGLKPAEKLTLLALADNADDETGVCWPSLDRLARKTCQSERNVRRMIRRLESLGQVTTKHRAVKHTNRYVVKPDQYALSALLEDADNLSGFEEW